MTIKNIFWDFGNTLVPLELDQMKQKLRELGGEAAAEAMDGPEFKKLWKAYDQGLDTAQFRISFRQVLGLPLEVTDEQIDEVWNAMLGEMPESRYQLIIDLHKKGYRQFLLSNSNEIHYHSIQKRFGKFFEILDEQYFSQIVHMSKPNRDIYKYVLSDSDSIPDESLFLDDRGDNVTAAQEVGMHAMVITDIISSDVIYNEIERIDRVTRYTTGSPLPSQSPIFQQANKPMGQSESKLEPVPVFGAIRTFN